MKKGPYRNFILFSPGSVGDHLVMVDFANHFYESTKIPSLLLLKHPSPFLHSLAAPYLDHISHLDFRGLKGVLQVLALALRSIYEKNCYVLLFPIPLPRYMKAFVYFIRFFTRSRFVGFNHEGTKFFPHGSGYASILGKENCIPLEAEMFYESANKMLAFLGCKETDRKPRLDYIYQASILDKLHLHKGGYVVMHIVPSYKFRSLPQDRWNAIIKELLNRLPGVKIVFTGSSKDTSYIESCLLDIPRDNIVLAAGKTEKGAQELLTLYANAKVNVTVQTGNGLIINMLHVPTVVVNIKGTAMFYYDFNEEATILFSEKDCICDPFRTSCNFVQYKGGEYMACIFNIKDEDVIDAVLQKYNEK